MEHSGNESHLCVLLIYWIKRTDIQYKDRANVQWYSYGSKPLIPSEWEDIQKNPYPSCVFYIANSIAFDPSISISQSISIHIPSISIHIILIFISQNISEYPVAFTFTRKQHKNTGHPTSASSNSHGYGFPFPEPWWLRFAAKWTFGALGDGTHRSWKFHHQRSGSFEWDVHGDFLGDFVVGEWDRIWDKIGFIF